MLSVKAPPPVPPDLPVTTWTFSADSEEDTRRLGQALGHGVGPGSIIALSGDLGAGKTCLVRSIVEGLGGNARDVSSPTFVLLQNYSARLSIYHADAYRIGSLTEFLDLGAEEWLGGDGVSVVEWGERVRDALPQDHMTIEITITGTTTRLFTISSAGDQSSTLLRYLRDALPTSTQ